MEQVRLYLTRHGETLENRRHVLQGQLPGTLSDTGLRQASTLSPAAIARRCPPRPGLAHAFIAARTAVCTAAGFSPPVAALSR